MTSVGHPQLGTEYPSNSQVHSVQLGKIKRYRWPPALGLPYLSGASGANLYLRNW